MTPDDLPTLRRKAKTAARAVDRTGRAVESAYTHGGGKERDRAVKAYYAALDNQDAIEAQIKALSPEEEAPCET
jgi:hypothetical protein